MHLRAHARAHVNAQEDETVQWMFGILIPRIPVEVHACPMHALNKKQFYTIQCSIAPYITCSTHGHQKHKTMKCDLE